MRTNPTATTKIIRRQLVDKDALEKAKESRRVRAPGRIYTVRADGTIRRVK